jgi:hypothetical protein
MMRAPGNAASKRDARPARGVGRRREQDLEGHERHGERQHRNDRHRLRPFRPEHGQHQRLGRNGEAQIEGKRDEEDEPHRLEESGPERIGPVLHPRIGGEGDLVDRRHELGGQDLGQEKRGRVEAEIVRREDPRADEDVRLALEEPAELDRHHRASVADERPGAGEAEARPYERARRDRHSDRPAPPQDDGGPDQGPDTEALIGAGQRRRCAEGGRDEVDDRLAPEIDLAAEERARKRDERGREIEHRLDPQQVGDLGLAVIGRGEGRSDELDCGERAVEEDEEAEDLPDLLALERLALDQRRGEAPAVHQVEEDEHDLGHREQAVIGRIEEADDHEGRRPGDELGDDLAPRAPQDGALHPLAERGRRSRSFGRRRRCGLGRVDVQLCAHFQIEFPGVHHSRIAQRR